MQPRPEGGLWAAARLVRSEPRHCRWRGAKLRLRAGLQRALGRLSLGLSRGRCLVSQMVVSDREPFPHTAQSTFWSRGLWAALRLCVPPIVAPRSATPTGSCGDPHRASCLYPVESVQRTTRYSRRRPRRAGWGLPGLVPARFHRHPPSYVQRAPDGRGVDHSSGIGRSCIKPGGGDLSQSR